MQQQPPPPAHHQNPPPSAPLPSQQPPQEPVPQQGIRNRVQNRIPLLANLSYSPLVSLSPTPNLAPNQDAAANAAGNAQHFDIGTPDVPVVASTDSGGFFKQLFSGVRAQLAGSYAFLAPHFASACDAFLSLDICVPLCSFCAVAFVVVSCILGLLWLLFKCGDLVGAMGGNFRWNHTTKKAHDNRLGAQEWGTFAKSMNQNIGDAEGWGQIFVMVLFACSVALTCACGCGVCAFAVLRRMATRDHDAGGRDPTQFTTAQYYAQQQALRHEEQLRQALQQRQPLETSPHIQSSPILAPGQPPFNAHHGLPPLQPTRGLPPSPHLLSAPPPCFNAPGPSPLATPTFPSPPGLLPLDASGLGHLGQENLFSSQIPSARRGFGYCGNTVDFARNVNLALRRFFAQAKKQGQNLALRRFFAQAKKQGL